jgi:hypothetical protein
MVHFLSGCNYRAVLCKRRSRGAVTFLGVLDSGQELVGIVIHVLSLWLCDWCVRRRRRGLAAAAAAGDRRLLLRPAAGHSPANGRAYGLGISIPSVHPRGARHVDRQKAVSPWVSRCFDIGLVCIKKSQGPRAIIHPSRRHQTAQRGKSVEREKYVSEGARGGVLFYGHWGLPNRGSSRASGGVGVMDAVRVWRLTAARARTWERLHGVSPCGFTAAARAWWWLAVMTGDCV